MSRPAAPTGSGGDELPAQVPTAPMRAAPSQRPRLKLAYADAPVAAAASSSSSSSLPPALRCAADTVDVVFSFLSLKELPAVVRVCSRWFAVAQKGKARAETFDRVDRLAALCRSVDRSPLCRHIRTVEADDMSLATLRDLAALPALTSLIISVDAAELDLLLEFEQRGPQQALTELRGAFPPRLRNLTLTVTTEHSPVVCQLLLYALPAMSALEQLTLSADKPPHALESLSLEPLLQLPRLSFLGMHLGRLSMSHLQTIKQIAHLRRFQFSADTWNAERRAAFCRPPHRLQQLEELALHNLICDEATMAELVHLQGLTALNFAGCATAAFSLLARFPLLQRLSIPLLFDAAGLRAIQPADGSLLVSALSACSALTSLSVQWGAVSDSFASQLLQAVPLLRSLSIQFTKLPSLLFLRAAPQLEELSLLTCWGVPCDHLVDLGSSVPRLRRLVLERCSGVHLDPARLRLLTPPKAPALPQLQSFRYVPAPTQY